MISSHRYQNVISGDDPIDFKYLRSFYQEVSSGIIDHYFRARLIGYENIPTTGPVILASNHSGNAFPHDSFVLDQLLWRCGNFRKNAKFRPLYSPKLALNWWMRPFGLDNWWRLFGAIDQTYINFDRIISRGGRVIYYPEGIPGIGKGFNRRYQLQPFQPSFIKLAARYDTPVLPVYGINAEWINPASLTFRWLDHLGYKIAGIPFVPVPLILLAGIFPFFFYFSFPSNMKFIIGKPISIRQWLKKNLSCDPVNPSRTQALKAAEHIRLFMQNELDQYVRQYGQKPYDLKSLISRFRAMDQKRWITSPFGWPVLFTRHYRKFFFGRSIDPGKIDSFPQPQKTQKKHNLTSDKRFHWDLIGYYIPLGWLFLMLFRKIRKPPIGNRGLEPGEIRRKEGRYVWSIARETVDSAKGD